MNKLQPILDFAELTGITERDRFVFRTYDHFVEIIGGVSFRQDGFEVAATALALTWNWMGLAQPRSYWKTMYPAFAQEFQRLGRQHARPSKALVTTAVDYAGGSLVAASKLLHFALPGVYPIWDGNVAIKTHGSDNAATMQNVSFYLEYAKELPQLRMPSTLSIIIGAWSSLEWSDVRQKEILLYFEGRKVRRMARQSRSRQRRLPR